MGTRTGSISSEMTFVYKFIFTPIWTVLFGVGAIATQFSKAGPDLLFLLVWIVGSLTLFLFCGRLKKVWMVEDNLYISNYFREIKVPLLDVKTVSESLLLSPRIIKLQFENETSFGRSIVFMPPIQIFLFFRSHPLADQLLSEVEKAKERAK